MWMLLGCVLDSLIKFNHVVDTTQNSVIFPWQQLQVF